MVHRLGDLRDLGESLDGEMNSLLHHAKNDSELPELIGFRRSQGIRFEERDDSRSQLMLIEHSIHEKILAMVVPSAVQVHLATPELVSDQMQHMCTALTLHDREARLDHPPDPHAAIAMDREAEAAFAVDEADDPLLDSWPFLLIARTGRIVTSHAPTLPGGSDTAGTAGCSGVPANSQLHSCRHRHEGQTGCACSSGFLP